MAPILVREFPRAGSLQMESNRLECNVEAEARILLHFFSSERGSRSPSEVHPSGTISL
jgi:hypothetical protein